MANYLTNTEDLTTVANAIRTKGGTSAQLTFPSGFATAIGNIEQLLAGKKIGYGVQFLLEPTQHIIFSFDFEPKAIIFSSILSESTLDAYLPTVEGKTVYSLFACNYIPYSSMGNEYTFQNFTRYTKGDTSNAFIGASSVSYLFNIVYNTQTQKWDVDVGPKFSSTYFFAGTPNVVSTGLPAGVPYHLIVLGDGDLQQWQGGNF